MKRMLLLLVLATSASALAEESPDVTNDPRPPQAMEATHPNYASDARWIGAMLASIGGLFVAAMIIGPIVRAEAPQAVPPASSHEEDPSADRHG